MNEWGKAVERLKKRDEQSAGPPLSVDVKSSSNRIYFYAPVHTKSVLAFNEELQKTRNNLLHQSIVQGTPPAPIRIHINSGGGSVFDGLSAMDSITRCDIRTVSLVDGWAASAATFLSMAADERLITPNSYMLIHQLSSGMWGKYEEFKDHMENIDKLMETIRQIYIKKSKIPSKVLRELLKHDLYFDAQTCIKYGLVDGIL